MGGRYTETSGSYSLIESTQQGFPSRPQKAAAAEKRRYTQIEANNRELKCIIYILQQD